MTARLDGSEAVQLISSESHWLYWPNGITLSDSRDYLYWAEAYYDRIEGFNVSKNNLTAEVSVSASLFNMAHGFLFVCTQGRINQTRGPVPQPIAVPFSDSRRTFQRNHLAKTFSLWFRLMRLRGSWWTWRALEKAHRRF